MNYSNAKAGIKNLYHASCCELGLLGLSLLLELITVINGDIEGAIFGILAIFVLILAIAILVLKVMGSYKAAKDEGNFKLAFYLIVAALVLSVINGVINNIVDNHLVGSIVSIIISLLEVGFVYFIVKGIINIFTNQGNSEMVNFAKRTLLIILVAYGIAVILSAVYGFLNNHTVMGILELISTIFDIAAVVMTFLLLKKSLETLNFGPSPVEPKEEEL